MLDLKRVMCASATSCLARRYFVAAAGLREWPYAVTGYLGLSHPKLPATLHLRTCVVFNLEELYDLETLWQVCFRRIYPVLDSDRVIIDAGANVGFFRPTPPRRIPSAKYGPSSHSPRPSSGWPDSGVQRVLEASFLSPYCVARTASRLMTPCRAQPANVPVATGQCYHRYSVGHRRDAGGFP